MRKSTHIGSCQCCGSVQKLPEGHLSTHGYHVRWGFFDGICRGTQVLPYEQSCDLIKGFIESAQERKADLEAYIASLLQPATEPKGWWHQYISGDGHRSRSGYKWIQVELREVKKLHADGTEYYTEKVYVDHQGKEKNLYHSGYYGGVGKDLLTVATELNRTYAENDCKPRVEQLESYIKWQQKRVADWKLVELKPIEEK
jgi:hypothetical protein